MLFHGKRYSSAFLDAGETPADHWHLLIDSLGCVIHREVPEKWNLSGDKLMFVSRAQVNLSQGGWINRFVLIRQYGTDTSVSLLRSIRNVVRMITEEASFTWLLLVLFPCFSEVFFCIFLIICKALEKTKTKTTWASQYFQTAKPVCDSQPQAHLKEKNLLKLVTNPK